jgi:hypothetical protein
LIWEREIRQDEKEELRRKGGLCRNELEVM